MAVHHDDSDVTLNVCLGREFTGATLSFCGGFGAADHRKHVHTYTHQVGRGIIHLGTHRHGADNIQSGERFSLIVWSTGSYRDSEEYKATHGRNLHGTDKGVPDQICLSYTHDPDYGEYLPYPSGKAAKPEARKMHVARYSAAEASERARELKEGGTADFKQQVKSPQCEAGGGHERAEGGAVLGSVLGLWLGLLGVAIAVRARACDWWAAGDVVV